MSDNPYPNHRTLEECESRYPRLVRAMKWCACLSSGEAAAAIRDYRDGFKDAGGEAVQHYAGSEPNACTYVIRRAIAARHIVKRMYEVKF